MAFDGLTVAALVAEFDEKLKNGRIDKVTQPYKDEVVLLIRAGGSNHRLLLSANSSMPRVHLTEISRENPAAPPLFCMLLRKHITSGKLVGFYQPEFERILVMEIEARDELGDISIKKLYIEMMGRHSNIILIDGQGKILGAAKTTDLEVARPVMPGMRYSLPPSQNKLNPVTATEEELAKINANDKEILRSLTGVSPIIARELENENIYAFFHPITFRFIILENNSKYHDFSAVDIFQYDGMEKVEFSSMSEAIEKFYELRDRQERMTQKSADITRFVKNAAARCEKKISLLMIELEASEKREEYKIMGDLLTANLHNLKGGDESVRVLNYYTGEMTDIALDIQLTPAKNAQRYYIKYNKAKTAEVKLSEQLKIARDELEYWGSVMVAIAFAESEQDLEELREELNIQKRKDKRKLIIPSEPKKFETSDGFTVLLGRNNLQNDRLTLKMADKKDLWFHVKGIPGSHVILKGDTLQAIYEAAEICARHSRAKDDSKISVDYTQVKNVKKPRGAKPGMVIYENYKTIVVDSKSWN